MHDAHRWPKDQRSYQGVISQFTPETCYHTVRYDDGDMRSYDMKSRVYQVLSHPEDPAQPKGLRTFARRPLALGATNVSLHMLDCINLFGQLGGLDALLLRLSLAHPSSGLLHRPLPFGCLKRTLHIVYALRSTLEKDMVAELCFSFKEVLPGAVAALGQQPGMQGGWDGLDTHL